MLVYLVGFVNYFLFVWFLVNSGALNTQRFQITVFRAEEKWKFRFLERMELMHYMVERRVRDD